MASADRLERAAADGDAAALRQLIDDARRRADPQRLALALGHLATHQPARLWSTLMMVEASLLEEVLRSRVGVASSALALDIAAALGWCPRYVAIGAGRYWRGGRRGTMWDDDDEFPTHDVVISRSFLFAATPVTQAQWDLVMGDAVPNPSVFKHPDRPVERVTWRDAVGYCERLAARTGLTVAQPGGAGLRLPTEAEWEYACRAGTQADTYAGDLQQGVGADPVLDPLAWYWDNSNGGTHPVAQRRPNAWGLYDMLGNVQEWCLDWYGPYDDGVQRDPVGPVAGSRRVFRGGSWDVQPMYCRCARRSDFRASAGFSGVQGLRPVWGSGEVLQVGS